MTAKRLSTKGPLVTDIVGLPARQLADMLDAILSAGLSAGLSAANTAPQGSALFSMADLVRTSLGVPSSECDDEPPPDAGGEELLPELRIVEAMLANIPRNPNPVAAATLIAAPAPAGGEMAELPDAWALAEPYDLDAIRRTLLALAGDPLPDTVFDEVMDITAELSGKPKPPPRRIAPPPTTQPAIDDDPGRGERLLADALALQDELADDHYLTAPIEVAEAASVEAEAAPAEVSEAAPIEVAEAAPIEVAEAASVEVVEATPVEVAEAAPVEVTEAAPAEIAEAAPVEVAEAAPVEVVEAAPAEIAEAAPVEVAEAAPVEVVEAAPEPASPDTAATPDATAAPRALKVKVKPPRRAKPPPPAAPPPTAPPPIAVAPQPVMPEPVMPEPVAPEPAVPQPVVLEPVVPEPVVPEPAIPQPVVPEPVMPEPVAAAEATDSDDVLLLTDEVPAFAEVEIAVDSGGFPITAPPLAEPMPPPTALAPEPAEAPPAAAAPDQAAVAERGDVVALVEAIIAAHRPADAPPGSIRGDSRLPERVDALENLLADPPPANDFIALDFLTACWTKGANRVSSRAVLAAAQNLSRNFGLPGKLPMASCKAWKMLDAELFQEELAHRLMAVFAFISDWQRSQRTFLILEHGEIELIEYLFEALHPADHLDLLANVMNIKALSNRRMGLLRRVPNQARKQVQPLLASNPQEALVQLAHTKALLERIAEPNGFAPIIDAASKALEEVDKLMKQAATAAAPPPLPGPPGAGGGMALGRIGA